MKKIIRKIKNWLIDKLGGYTKEDMNLLYKSQAAVRKLMIQAWEKTVQEICRKSGNSYYDWCCEYCNMNCDKRNGWCERFHPINKVKHDMWALEQELKRPEMVDLPERNDKSGKAY